MIALAETTVGVLFGILQALFIGVLVTLAIGGFAATVLYLLDIRITVETEPETGEWDEWDLP